MADDATQTIDPRLIEKLAAAAEKLAGFDPVSAVAQQVAGASAPDWVSRHRELDAREREHDARGESLPGPEYRELRASEARYNGPEGEPYRTPQYVMPPSVGLWDSLPELRPDQATRAAAVGREPARSPGPGADAASGDVATELLADIRAGIGKLVEKAATGQTPPPAPPGAQQPGYGWGDALKPVTDPIRNSKLGRIVGQAKARMKPAVRAFRKARGAKSPGPNPGRATAAGGAAKPPAGLGGGASEAATAGRGAAAAGAAEGAAAGGAAAGGAGAAAAAGPVGIAVVAIVAVTDALIQAAKAGRDLAYQQEDYARKLAEVSPSQAANVAELDVNRQLRMLDSGENTAGTSADLMESINKFEEAIKPFEDFASNVMNTVGAEVMEALASVLEYIREGVEIAKAIARADPTGYGKAAVDAIEERLKRGRAEKERDREGPLEMNWDFLDRVYREQERKAAAGRAALDATRRIHDGRH